MTVAEELIQKGRQQGRQEAMRESMTAAEELIQEGRQQGRQEAMEVADELIRQNKIKFISALLKLNIDAHTIASAAELPLTEVETIIAGINRAGSV